MEKHSLKVGAIQRNREELKMTNDNWTQSPFAWLEETQIAEYIEPPPVDPLDTLIDDLLPRIRFEGEQLETDLSPAGMTEWIPGVDPVGELVEESILPPLPPAVTTLMRSYVRGTETLPAGGNGGNILSSTNSPTVSTPGIHSVIPAGDMSVSNCSPS